MADEDAGSVKATEIAAFIDERVTELARRFGPTHPWTNWPRFLFHVTDVTNAASILACGHLLSRTRAEAAGYAKSDNASRRVIASTAPWVLDSVRLYFRPRTPTFFHNEGIRPSGLRSPFDAHCPVPVAFLFDAAAILARADVQVSDGNLATRRRRVGRGLDFLRSLPWEWIFHEGIPRGSDEQTLATFHRHAEVAVPGELPLAGALRYVGVRSAAEFETLRTLLNEAGDPDANRWMSHVFVDSRAQLFFQR